MHVISEFSNLFFSLFSESLKATISMVANCIFIKLVASIYIVDPRGDNVWYTYIIISILHFALC